MADECISELVVSGIAVNPVSGYIVDKDVTDSLILGASVVEGSFSAVVSGDIVHEGID